MVYGTCKRTLGNPADAEEVTQDCFIELARPDTVVRRSLGGWLHTVATRRSLDRIKADHRRRVRETRFAEEVGATTEPNWSDVQGYIDEAIASLPERYRDPIVMRFIENMTQEAIAEELKIPRSTVQYRIQRGLKHIRGSMKRRGVVVGLATLSVLFIGNVAEAAPVALTASLGRLAIAASMNLAPAGTVTMGTGSLAAKVATLGTVTLTAKQAVGIAGSVAILAGATYTAATGGLTREVDRDGDRPHVTIFERASAMQGNRSTENLGPSWSGAVEGQVVNAKGHPLPGASVLLVQTVPVGFLGAKADIDGRFRFEGLLVGGTCILVARDEHVGVSQRLPISVPDAGKPVEVTVRMPHGSGPP